MDPTDFCVTSKKKLHDSDNKLPGKSFTCRIFFFFFKGETTGKSEIHFPKKVSVTTTVKIKKEKVRIHTYNITEA